MTVPFMVMLSWSETSQRFFGTYVPQNDRKITLRMTVPYIVMLSGAKHLRERRFFASAQNDRKITLRMTFNVTFVRTKVTKSRRDKRSS